MKNRSFRILSLLCAVTLLICAFSAWAAAEETPATPTDLTPVQPQEEPAPTPAQGEAEEGIETVEVVITKALRLGQSWEGTMKRNKPAILKLDLEKACTVHMLLEGKNVWATMEKADRQTENPPRTRTDPETKQVVLSWQAETGSYLITLGPVEPNLLAKAKVTFLDDEAFAAWEKAQEEVEAEEETPEAPAPDASTLPNDNALPNDDGVILDNDGVNPSDDDVIPNEADVIPSEVEGSTLDEPEEESKPENVSPDDGGIIPNDDGVIPNEAGEFPSEDSEGSEPEEQPEEEQPQREIKVDVKWDVSEPHVWDTAHFVADMSDYEGLTYTIQWQYGPDGEIWYDIPGETNPTMDVVITPEKNLVYWRILVFLEEEQED